MFLPRGTRLALLLGAATWLRAAGEAPPSPAASLPGDVLAPAERQEFFQQYFDRMTEPPSLQRFRSRAQWEAYRGGLREKVRQAIGLRPWPPKPPLDPRIAGRLDRDGYRIERVYYQVLPGIYASGYLYVPGSAQPAGADAPAPRLPAVLNPHGHWAKGAADPTVQSRCIALAKLGFVAFCPDSTHEIDLGVGLCPIGLMTWNNIRALDYLQSLPFVDPGRLGCTGASGGGQQTMFLAALDERVQVAVPAVLVSYFRRILFVSEETHCFCNHAPGIARGTDEPEIAALLAPRPTRFICATGDWTREFPREEFPPIQRIFDLTGGVTDCVQFDKPHNYDRDSREQMYFWMARHLLHRPGAEPVREPPVQPEDPETLRTLGPFPPGCRDLQAAPAWFRQERLFHAPDPEQRGPLQAYLQRLRAQLPALLGLPASGPDRQPGPEARRAPRAESRGPVSIAGFAGEKWLLETEPGVRLPAWWFAPPGRKPRGPAAVIVHPEGKQGLLGQRATLVRALLDAHVAVLALDPCFRGELRRNWKWNLVIWGQPEEGLAAADLNRSAAWLRSRDDVDPARVYALGLGPLGPAALFAAALDPRWAGAAADGPWALEAGRPAPDAIPNLLRHGDLPQCAALVAPRPLWLNQAGPAFAFAARAYATLGAAGALRRTEAEPGAWASALGQAWGALLDRGQDH